MEYSLTLIHALATLLPGHVPGNFKIGMIPHAPSQTFCRHAPSQWQFASHHANRTIVWTTRPFRRTDSKKHIENCYLRLERVKKQGNVRCSVIRSYDTTKLDRRKRRAAVVAAVRGSGTGKLLLTVGLTDPGTAAGKYETVVQVTVTSP